MAEYSSLDQQLLHQLAQRRGCPGGAELRLDWFDVEACHTQQDFEAYVPGIGNVYQTPVVGLWVDGVLREKAWGAAGRDLVERVCGVKVPLS